VKVTSPVGDYEYEIKSVRLEGGSLVVEGNLGVWETTMSIEPADWARLARRSAKPLGLLAGGLAAVAAARRLRR
jgi:hypothetical protein